MIRKYWQLILVVFWLLFTVALSVWWIVFGIKQLSQMHALGGSDITLLRQQRMLLSEGIFLICTQLAGGITLFYYVFYEKMRNQRITDFFAAFSHDLKTAIARLRLRSEGLTLKLHEQGIVQEAEELIKDTVHLELQLENSLLFSSPEARNLYLENISFKEIVQRTQIQYPEIKIIYDDTIHLHSDRRLFECVLKNIVQNAIQHGRASELRIISRGKGNIAFVDNGIGYQGNVNNLGKKMMSSNATGGSGLGLNVVRRLVTQLGGEVFFENVNEGFSVHLKNLASHS